MNAYQKNSIDDYREYLDRVYPPIEVCGYSYYASKVFADVDINAFNIGMSDWKCNLPWYCEKCGTAFPHQSDAESCCTEVNIKMIARHFGKDYKYIIAKAEKYLMRLLNKYQEDYTEFEVEILYDEAIASIEYDLWIDGIASDATRHEITNRWKRYVDALIERQKNYDIIKQIHSGQPMEDWEKQPFILDCK